jgi:hypothetical protein
MPHAAFVQVEIDPESDPAHRHGVLNEFVIPQMKALPGFRSAIWLNDGEGVGTCMARFDTEEQAERALTVLAPDNGPRVIHAGTGVVELEA